MTHLSPYQMGYNIQAFWVVAPCWVCSCWWFETSGNACLMIQCHIPEGLNLQQLYCESLRPGSQYKFYVIVWCVVWAEVSWYCCCSDLLLYACGGNIVVIVLYFHSLYTVNFCCEWPLSLALPSNYNLGLQTVTCSCVFDPSLWLLWLITYGRQAIKIKYMYITV